MANVTSSSHPGFCIQVRVDAGSRDKQEVSRVQRLLEESTVAPVTILEYLDCFKLQSRSYSSITETAKALLETRRKVPEAIALDLCHIHRWQLKLFKVSPSPSGEESSPVAVESQLAQLRELIRSGSEFKHIALEWINATGNHDYLCVATPLSCAKHVEVIMSPLECV